MKKLSLLWGIALTLLLSFSSLHAEDFWQDTLWIRKMPLGGNVFAKVMFHPDGKSVFATSDQYMFEYDVQSGALVKTRTTNSGLRITDYQMSSDNKYFIILTQYSGNIKKGYLELWDIEQGFIRKSEILGDEFGLTETVSLAVSPDMKYAYVGYARKALDKISIETGTVEKTNDTISGHIALSPDGKELCINYSKPTSFTALVNPDNLNLRLILQTPMGITKYSHDGRYIAGFSGKTVLLFDRETKKMHSLSGHMGGVRDFCFTNDGKYLISVASGESSGAPAKGGYRVWDVNTKLQIFEAPYYTGGNSITVSNNNNNIATQPGNLIRMWKANGISNIINSDENNEFTIAPNPTHTSLTLYIPKYSNQALLCTIYNNNAEKVWEKFFYLEQMTEGKLLIDISSLLNGYYTCLCTMNNTTLSSSFIINR